MMSSVTSQGSGMTPRYPPRAETTGRQLRESQVPLSLTGAHPCALPDVTPALTSVFSWLSPWCLRPAACAWLPGPSRCHQQPFPLHTHTGHHQGLSAPTEPSGTRGTAAKPKPCPQVPLPTVSVNQTSLPTSTAKSTTAMWLLASFGGV